MTYCRMARGFDAYRRLMAGDPYAASGIEAPSGVETGNTDSTEGESPARTAGTPNPTPSTLTEHPGAKQ